MTASSDRPDPGFGAPAWLTRPVVDTDSIPLPPVGLRFMNESDERFVAQGRELAQLLVANGLGARTNLLDIGCGYGRLAVGLLADDTSFASYRGFDILRRHIGWCAENLTAVDPRLSFTHLDVHNPRYNPDGKAQPESVRFPASFGTVGMACAFSVFTHLYRSTIEHYLDELVRTLEPGGVAVTTWLLWDDERRPTISERPCAYPMAFQLDDDTLYSDDSDPLRAIAFRTTLVEKLVTAHGLRVKQITRGSWDGATKSDVFQDLVLIERPKSVTATARGALAEARGRAAEVRQSKLVRRAARVVRSRWKRIRRR